MKLPLVLVFAFGLAGPSVARADPQAVVHYRQGQAFLEQRAYASAITEFQVAYAIDHNAGHLYNIARAYDLDGDPRGALDYYRRFLDAEPSSPRADEVRVAIAAATRTIAEDDDRRRIMPAPPAVEPNTSSAVAAPVRDLSSRRRISPTWLVVGVALIAAGVALDVVPASADNHRLDVTDFAAPALYGLGATAIVVGVF